MYQFTLKKDLQQTINRFVDGDNNDIMHTHTPNLIHIGGENVNAMKKIKKTNMYHQQLKIDELLEKQFKKYNIQYFK